MSPSVELIDFSARRSGSYLMWLPLTAGQALCFFEQVEKLAASFSLLAAAAKTD